MYHVISEIVDEMNSVATTIASAFEERSAATGEIATKADQAAGGTGVVSSNVARVSLAASETDAAAMEVLDASEKLAQQAEEMRSTIETFWTAAWKQAAVRSWKGVGLVRPVPRNAGSHPGLRFSPHKGQGLLS